jgi:hypothetical protein
VKHRRERQRFSHAQPSRSLRVPGITAAVLAAAATTGILFTQFTDDAGSRSPNVMIADAALAGSHTLQGELAGETATPRKNQSASRANPRVSQTPATAPSTPASASAPAATASPAAPAIAVPPAELALPAVPPTAAVAAAAQAAPTPPAEKVLDVQFQAQINSYYCGPAAARIALTARGKTPSQDAVAKLLGTTTGGTNSAADTTRGLNSVLGETLYQTHLIPNATTAAQTEQFQADMVRAITNGKVVVSNIVGSAVDVAGLSHGYGNGHFLTVIGYRDGGQTVRVADPANGNGDSMYYWMSTAKFAKWMSNRGYSA